MDQLQSKLEKLLEKAKKWDNCLDLGKKCTPEDYLAIGAKCLERELEKDKTIIPMRKENKLLKENIKKSEIIKDRWANKAIQRQVEINRLKQKLGEIDKVVYDTNPNTPSYGIIKEILKK